MKLRKPVSVALIAAMLFGLLPAGTALAGANPGPLVHLGAPATSHVISGWFWAAFACPASIVLAGIVANFRDNRQLTEAEAWSCGVLFWFAKPRTTPTALAPG
jgi:hypothetical protein